MSVKVLSESESGGNKVKVAGIMVSEEGGEGGVGNWGAVEMAHDGANWGEKESGTFDIRGWIGGKYLFPKAKKP